MAGHDQRILKFLEQNSEMAPTITDMMTKLSISISEISESLNTLETAGLVTKRSNAHGIECWFPSTVPLAPKVTSGFQNASASQNPLPIFNADAAPGQVYSPRAVVPPTTPVPKSAPVPVRHIQPLEHAASQTQTFNAIPSTKSSIKMAKQNSEAQQGVGLLTFALGLIATAGFSTWLAFQLATNEIHKASLAFVDQKGLKATTASLQDFQVKTKMRIASLEEQIKQLREQLNASHVAVESLKVAKSEIAAMEPPKKLAQSPRALPKPEKPEKKPSGHKAMTKSEAAVVKAKPAKKVQVVNKPKPSDKPAKLESARALPLDESTASPATYNGPSGEVPKPPGIGDQDLPPPPGE